MACYIQLPSFILDRSQISTDFIIPTGHHNRQVEKQIIGFIDIVIKVELQTIVEGGEIQSKVKTGRTFPFQIFIRQRDRSYTDISVVTVERIYGCLLYTSPSPRD